MLLKLKNFFLKNTSTSQTLVKNTLWIGFSTILIKIFRALIIIYAAGLLGTEEYGIFTYATGIVAIFAVFSDMGLSSILTRELSKNIEKMREYFSTALFIKFSLLSGMTILILSITPFISKFEASTKIVPIIALSIIFESLRSFFYSIPRAQNRMQTESFFGIMNELFCISLIIFFFLKNPSPETLAHSFMIGNGIGLIATLVFNKNYLLEAPKYFIKELVTPLIKLTMPFAVLGIFGIFMTNIDSVIIGIFGNEEMLGLFGAAQRPIGILYIIPGFLSTSLLPLLSLFIKEKQNEKVTSLIKISSQISLTLALPIIVGGIIIAGPLINSVFGISYMGAVLTFQLLLVTLLFVFPGTIFAEVLIAGDKQKIFLFTGIVGALLNVSLDFLLIPKHGIAGSAVATIIAQAVVNIFFYLKVRQSYKVNMTQGLYKSIIAVIIMAITTYFLTTLSWPLLIILPLSAIIYIGLLLLMKDRSILELRRSFK